MNGKETPAEDPSLPFNCPACDRQLLIPESMRGVQVMCPHEGCGTIFEVPALSTPAPAPVPVVEPPPPPSEKPRTQLKGRGTPLKRPANPRSHHTPASQPSPPTKSTPAAPKTKGAPTVLYIGVGIFLLAVLLLFLFKPPSKPAASPAVTVAAVTPAATATPPASTAAGAAPATEAAGQKPKPKRGELTDAERERFNQSFTQHDEEKKARQKEFFEGMKARAELGAAEDQSALGRMYLNGEGTAPDPDTARIWLEKAAAQKDTEACFTLADLETRAGNTKQAAKWCYEAGASVIDAFRKEDPGAETVINQALSQLAILRAMKEYQDLLGKIYGIDMRLVGTGTGWFIDQQNLVTCHHVIEGFDPALHRLFIQSDIIPKTEVEIVKSSSTNDVAVLRLAAPLKTVRGIRLSEKEPTLGASTFTIGYPHIGALGKAPKYNDGKISALKGMEDSERDYTISVPVQPGNSGGPLLNKRGEAIGVIVAQMKFMQNVNYAVKLHHLRDLLAEIDWKPVGDIVTETPADMEDAVPLVQSSVAIVLLEMKE